jgi:hypothetical protein
MFGVNLYPDTLRCRLHQDPELRMITEYPLEQQIEVDAHIAAQKLALFLSISPPRVINHLQHDPKMKRYHLPGVTKN